jgi:hypothetical protein
VCVSSVLPEKLEALQQTNYFGKSSSQPFIKYLDESGKADGVSRVGLLSQIDIGQASILSTRSTERMNSVRWCLVFMGLRFGI